MQVFSKPIALQNQSSHYSNWCFWAVLIVAFYYQIYRYPFEYGIEPPLLWRVGKYVLLGCLCLVTSLRFFESAKKFGLFEWAFLAVFSSLGIVGYIQQEKYLLQTAFCALVAFWIVHSVAGSISYRALARFLVLAWTVNSLFYLIQWIGLVFFNKGFVHASAEVLTSRFGGMLVEPLGAPYLSFLSLGLAYEFKGWSRWIIFSSSIVTLLMTHTLTAGLFLFLLAVIWIAHFVYKKGGWVASAILVVTGCVAAASTVLVFWYLKDTLPYFSEKWNVSIVTHAKYWWPSRWPLLPTPESQFSETWWVMSVQSIGILWTIVYGAVMFFLLRACALQAISLLSQRTDGAFNGVFLGIYLSGAFAVFGSLNQLYPAMYPVGLLFMLFCLMVKYNKISKMKSPAE